MKEVPLLSRFLGPESQLGDPPLPASLRALVTGDQTERRGKAAGLGLGVWADLQ